MFDDTLREDMRTLMVLNYKKEAIEAFLAKYPINKLLSSFLEFDETLETSKNMIIRDTIERLLRDNDTFIAIITDSEAKSILQRFITHEDEVFRIIFAETLLYNAEITKGILEQFSDDQGNEDLIGYIKIIYFLLSDELSDVGLKISKLMEKLSSLIGDKISIDYIFTHDEAIKAIRNLLFHENAVLSLRTFEMLVLVCNKNERLFTIFKEAEIIDQALDLYFKYAEDILEKLNLVDIISKLGQTETGASILVSHKCFNKIKQEAISGTDVDDPFVCKNIAVLLIDLVSHGKLKYTSKLFKDLEKRLESYMVQGFGEDLYVCYDMIYSFGRTMEGFNAVFRNKKILSRLCGLCHSTADLESSKALMAVAGLLKNDKTVLDQTKKDSVITLSTLNEKNNHAIEFIAVYLANPQLINGFIDINEPSFLASSVTYILEQLMLPFDDIEHIFLAISLSLVEIDAFLRKFCMNPKGLEYIHFKQAKEKHTFDRKSELKERIIQKIKETSHKDEFYEAYLKEWKIKETQRKAELMQYATEAS